MEQLTLKPRKALVEEPMECWDDDDLDIGGDDFTFRSASLATTATSHHRDSVSSRMSARSDFDSNHGDEEKYIQMAGDDEKSTFDAVASAARAGIPIPQNVPASALKGGTIKRLGGRKIKKIIQDDWDDGDLELPGEGGLTFKRQDASNFPDALRQVSGGSTQGSPVKALQPAPKFNLSPRPDIKPKAASANIMLERFRDEEDDDFFGDGGDTIKVSKSRQVPKLIPLITPPTPQKEDSHAEGDGDFDKDFKLPQDNEPLRLSTRRDIPKTPISLHDDADEWGEGGSLGTRHGGKRDRNSNRSSSATALSPSVSSSLTMESEDEGLDGLIIPSGPLHFDDILKRRQQDRSPDHGSRDKQAAQRVEAKDDFLTGLEIGDGDVFDSSKLTLNRNIKMKSARLTSPTRPKTAVSLIFGNQQREKEKPAPITTTSRLPRPLGGHERHPSSLEPVSESGGPILRSSRRSQSRMGGHSSHSSVTSIATPTTPVSVHSLAPSTPRRRDLGSKPSITALRNEPTTTNAQLLKLKRSMPTMRSFPQSPAKPMRSHYERPPSRTDGNRTNTRPKTPVERDRSGAESSMSHARKNPLPFLPAGTSSAQSHHVTIKTSRHFRRHDSESSNTSIELRPSSRAVSRATMRSPSPRRPRGADVLARGAAPKHTLTKPIRRKHFGDGFELDGFDDLPTSKDTEQRFVKEPIGRGPPKLSHLRNKVSQDASLSRTTTPAPLTPYSPARTRDDLPRFARDTNASRMAREHVIAQRAPSAQGAPLAALTNQWKAKVSATTGLSNFHAQSVKPKKIRGPPQKPQLIKPLGNLNNPKSIKGMYYNPYTYRWEGNENDLTSFDPPASSPSTASIPSHMFREKENQVYREKENTTPRPALIQNITSSQNVQVVGGMVFDPQRMCWLKMPSQQANSKSDAGDTMDGFDAFDEEEDVFKDVPDLEDNATKESDEVSGRKSDGASTLKDDWLVGEEFDVGPEFVRRQREEEDRWRRKCEKWVGANLDRGGDDWKWSIRDVVNE
ncbi:related to cytokinesis inhibitor byr4 [Rhynchosporium secalis]|uniref:Related to cytokinesis inhibitor byr4 n=1 Tax=Rhynchosporium secalis TaxID=38038 RepID=A0A1E1MIJ9_RHYSE|nr:related to cytokinesis inhibitor byr4 [Rhynchosporium secalis]